MKAVKVQSAPAGSPQFSVTNPAPSSAIKIENNVPIPKASQPGELLVRIKASTVIRDSLTWPELYEADSPSQLGNDFAGIVESVQDSESQGLKPGDEVYGMTSAARGGTWAEYAVVKSEEVYSKPSNLSWEEAAAVPLSTLTADQALFDQAKLETDATKGQKRVLITGAGGAVGMLLVQLALAAGHQVVAATSSNARNEEFLRSLGAKEIIEYPQLNQSIESFDAIIDTAGGDVLRQSWTVVKADGVIVSIDSPSYDFAEEHKKEGLTKGKESVRAVWFVVEPTKKSLGRVSDAVAKGTIKGVVAKTLPLEEAREAYDLAHTRGLGRGKVVLVI